MPDRPLRTPPTSSDRRMESPRQPKLPRRHTTVPNRISGNPSINQLRRARRPAASNCTAILSSTQSSLQYKPYSCQANSWPTACYDLAVAMPQRQSAQNLARGRCSQLARPYKRRFLLIALLALLGVGADLLQPLIYRAAINDVAGVRGSRGGKGRSSGGSHRSAAIAYYRSAIGAPGEDPTAASPDYVAPRTRQQAMTTLLWRWCCFFAISVVGYFLSLAADLASTGVACAIEAN